MDWKIQLLKMPTFSKLIYRFCAVPFEIAACFFVGSDQVILKLMQNNVKGPLGLKKDHKNTKIMGQKNFERAEKN